jgi:hypothetical protein
VPILAERDFECLLCGQPFSRVCADLILPEDQVCDKCLVGLEHLEGRERWDYIYQNRIDLKENADP